MRHISRFFIFCLLLCVHLLLNGQFYTTGTDPASVKWSQIKTEHYQVIFPKEFVGQAMRVARMLEAYYEASNYALDHRTSKIPVILHNRSVLSNGYVVWAPKRMELVTTPSQDPYPNDWLEQLVLHEGRHTVQVDKLNQGFTKLLNVPFGQAATGAMVAFVPLWFLEGDAVLNETAMSQAGRGREPGFMRSMKAIETQMPKRYSYDQAYLGSYNHKIPNYYQYGYQMVAYGNLKYGRNIWSNALDQVGQKPFTIAPFYFGLKKYGTSKEKLYHESMDSLRAVWEAELASKVFEDDKALNCQPNKVYTDYRHPIKLSDSSYLAVKTSMSDIGRFIKLEKSGKESVIYTPGNYFGNRWSRAGNKLAWEETILSPRWEQESFSVIKILDLHSGKEEVLHPVARHFSPSLHPEDDFIVVVNNYTTYHSKIEIYDLSTKYLVKSFSPPNPWQLSQLSWLNDSLVLCIATGEKGNAIYSLDIQSGHWNQVCDWSFYNYNQPVGWQGGVLFNWTYNGTENLWLKRLDLDSPVMLTNARYGVSDASVAGRNILFCQYGLEGYRIHEMPLDSLLWIPQDSMEAHKFDWAEDLSLESQKRIALDELGEYEIRPYNKFAHSLQAHSWVPMYADLDDLKSGEYYAYPGLTVFFQNNLSTVTSSIAYGYMDSRHYLAPSIELRGKLPVLRASFKYGDRQEVYDTTADGEWIDLSKNLIDAEFDISLPLRSTQSKFRQLFIPEVSLRYLNRYYKLGERLFEEGLFMDFNLYYHRMIKMAARDIVPRWGQVFYISRYLPLKHEELFRTNLTLRGELYFPGLGMNHSLKIKAGMEDGFLNRLSLPRGYQLEIPSNYIQDSYIASSEYLMPLIYPDLSFGPLAYLKRIHGKAFFDYAYFAMRQYGDFDVYSIGAELTAEVNFMRFYFPFSPTIRYSFQPQSNMHDVQFLFSILQVF